MMFLFLLLTFLTQNIKKSLKTCCRFLAFLPISVMAYVTCCRFLAFLPLSAMAYVTCCRFLAFLSFSVMAYVTRTKQ
jgi:hypothetical protein